MKTRFQLDRAIDCSPPDTIIAGYEITKDV